MTHAHGSEYGAPGSGDSHGSNLAMMTTIASSSSPVGAAAMPPTRSESTRCAIADTAARGADEIAAALDRC